MKIAGIQKNSFIDFKGKIAAVIFAPGCNLDCYYCHNRRIICGEGCRSNYSEEEVLYMLSRRRKFLDGVVISGGEPTLQPDIDVFIDKIKDIGYKVKLDTNGTNPAVVEHLVNSGRVDYVAMDIKAPFERYDEICGVKVNLGNIERSIALLMENRVDYEFRTTVVPDLGEDDILAIAERIRGAKRYILQQFRQPEPVDGMVDYRALRAPHSDSFIIRLSERVRKIVQQQEVRGIG